MTRHEEEQHGDKTDLVACTICNSLVRDRYLDQHVKSLKCRDAGTKKDRASRNALSVGRVSRTTSIQSQSGSSVSDIIQLCVNLLAECTPYGRLNWTLTPTRKDKFFTACHQTEVRPDTSILELQSLPICSIVGQFNSDSMDQDIVPGFVAFSYACCTLNGPSSTRV